jgi:hypothetical protein
LIKYRADRNLNQWLRGLLVQINDVFAAFMQFLGQWRPAGAHWARGRKLAGAAAERLLDSTGALSN